MLSRRGLFATAALIPLAGCMPTPPAASPGAPGSAPDASGSAAPAGAASGSAAAAAGAVLVYAPGAMASQTKALAEAFAKSGAGTVTFEVGHTPIKREQLAQGATPDVWIAASPQDLQAAADKGNVDKAGVKQVARTKLAVVVAPNNPGKINSFVDIARPGVKLLMGADTLPIGTATESALDKMEGMLPGLKDKILANVVSREMGVQPIVTKVQMGEAQAGIVFVTDVPADRKGVTVVEIPEGVNQYIALAAAPVTAGKNKAGAKAFIEFLVNGAGKEVLTAAGYEPPTA